MSGYAFTPLAKADIFDIWSYTVSQIMVTSLRSKWAVGKAVRAGLALRAHI